MNSAVPKDSKSASRKTYSCVRCSDRKVKCDRQYPCGACVKHSADCVFRAPNPPRKRRKRDQGVDNDVRAKHGDPSVSKNVARLDRTAGTTQPEPPQNTGHELIEPIRERASQLHTPASIASELLQAVTKTQLLDGQGQSKFVDNTLWTRVVEEFYDPEDAFESSSTDTSDEEGSEDEASYIMGITPKSNTENSHPPVDMILELWQAFTQNVDPLLKVLHVPTLQPVIEKAARDINAVSRNLETLMFAIYSAAIMSMKDEECRDRFGEPRKILLSRYLAATKTALARTKFMGTTSVIVLQALVIHIVSVRDIYNPRMVWTLSGVALRIAEALGLHQDGTSLGLPVFETEIRRRLWWHMKMNDHRTAELAGLAKFRNFDTHVNPTKAPANVNDHDLFLGMKSPAVESEKPTDAVFCNLRSSVGSFVSTLINKTRQAGPTNFSWDNHGGPSNLTVRHDLATEVQELIESKFLRYLDPSQPLQLMAMLFGRSAIYIGHFMANHPRRWTNQKDIPEEERQHVWDLGIKLLEQYDMMQSSQHVRQYSWYASYFMPWHALIHILDTLRAKPSMPDARKTWQLVGSIYEAHPDLKSNMKKTVNRAVGSLCLKAYNVYESALNNKGQSVPTRPGYIEKLDQYQQGSRKTSVVQVNETQRNLAYISQRSATDTSSQHDQSSITNTAILDANFSEAQPPPYPSISSTTHSSRNIQNNLNTSNTTSNTTFNSPPTQPPIYTTDLRWTTSIPAQSELSSMPPPPPNTNLTPSDLFLPKNETPIDWSQWDTWLADLNTDPSQTNFSTDFGELPYLS